nr:hypothetical protein BHM03_00030667 [Ipomoea batatas]GMC88977.1 hypothetical protein BHM03_00030667 [Ipomoea batatas]GMC90465.1 hypothetical protein BHM03_00030667 [Ipomoea batatas]
MTVEKLKQRAKEEITCLIGVVEGDRAREEGKDVFLAQPLLAGSLASQTASDEAAPRKARLSRAKLQISGGVRCRKTQATQLSGMSPNPGPPLADPFSVRPDNDAPIRPLFFNQYRPFSVMFLKICSISGVVKATP